MSKLFLEMSVSLDGFITGPDPGPEQGLGEGGEQLHEWAYELRSFKERHGHSGGEDSRDSEMLEDSFERCGAFVMGRGMFTFDEGPWGDEPSQGHWGDDPPFHGPVFVVTHHEREPLELEGGTTFTFVTDGVEAAVERAKDAAGEKDVSVAGGASVFRQCLRAGLIDEINIHLVPVLLGGGTRLFDGADQRPALRQTRVIESAGVTHLRYEVAAT